jgi:decaprenyl-phosphate phosphoribosyltransferase
VTTDQHTTDRNRSDGGATDRARAQLELAAQPAPAGRPTLAGHLAILRLDHWSKTVFVVPGIVLAWYFHGAALDAGALAWRVPLGLLSLSLIASSNYVVNELLDAPFDRFHPTKRLRPVPSGTVNVRLAFVQWIVVGLVGLALATPLGVRFLICAAALLLMGVLYNVPPFRLKDVVFLDVVAESVNNPIRLLAGWYLAMPHADVPPLSLILGYWMIGCYFMALKRFAEYRAIGDGELAATYRRPFARYNDDLLLVTAMGYASAAMLLFGAFAVRYRIELLLGFPLVALVMAIYLWLALRDASPVQTPERLYREPVLVAACVVCVATLAVLVAVDLPWLADAIDPDFPTMLDGGG